MRRRTAKHRRLVLGLLVPLLLAAGPAVQASAPGAPPTTSVAVDAAHPVGPVNPNLLGFAFDSRINKPEFTPLPSRTFRLDAGFQECSTLRCPRRASRSSS